MHAFRRFSLAAAVTGVILSAAAGQASACDAPADPSGMEATCMKPIDRPATEAPQRKSKLPPVAAAAIERAKAFKMIVRAPKQPSGETLVLLHGSGGNETTLLPIAAQIDPRATLVGIAGRITQEGKKRWYQRITPTSFDQADIRHEADAFAAFLAEAVKARKIDLERATFVGYSNGANLLAALSLLHPGLVQRAVLLRPMPVLTSIPDTDLKPARFLTVIGKTDETYARFGQTLADILAAHGARVESQVIARDHGLGEEDVAAVKTWLAAGNAVSMND